jgi:hypothetical protein
MCNPYAWYNNKKFMSYLTLKKDLQNLSPEKQEDLLKLEVTVAMQDIEDIISLAPPELRRKLWDIVELRNINVNV